MMARFLLDTNHLGEALRPVSRVRDRIGQLLLTGVRVDSNGILLIAEVNDRNGAWHPRR